MDELGEKQQTIRELLEQCHQAQLEIKGHLENNFDRNVTATALDEGRPPRPNVLDEIRDSLKNLNEAQNHTIQFLIKNVNQKL